MLVAIVSDTHDDIAITATVVELAKERGAEAIIHCGDLACSEIVAICSQLPFYFVFGNHDSDVVPDLTAAAEEYGAQCLGWGGIIELSQKLVAVTHGHMTSDLRPLLDAEPDYLLTGHTHELSDTRVGASRRICPGALFRAEPTAFAFLDLGTDCVEFVNMSE